jgi:hypothetical protein
MSVRELMDDPDRHTLTQRGLAAALGEKKAEDARIALERERRGLRS